MQTLVVPALPFFQKEFHPTATWVTWIATGFLLSSSVLTPILGKLGDTYGKERLLVISMAIFGIASLAAAFAWSLPSLIAFRILQGAGAAVFPLSFGIIRDEFPPEKIGLGIGTVSSVFGAGGGIGLVLSGVIPEHLPWHWLFLGGAGRRYPRAPDGGVAVPGRRAASADRHRADRAVRARVADQDADAPRLPGRDHAVPGAGDPADRDLRKRRLGLDVGANALAARGLGAAVRGLGADRAAGPRAAGGPQDVRAA